MKNQYIGDIGDYGKYGMLRYLEKNGIKLGINWYLTENDGSSDGKFTTYLDNDKERYRDPKLFDSLKKAAAQEDKSVLMIEQSEIFSSACFYHKLISRENRNEWHDNALKVLESPELIFCDPDNGLVDIKSKRSKASEKFIYPWEIVDYYNRGQNVVYYCQRAHRTREQWDKTKNEMIENICNKYGTVIEVVDNTERTEEQELVEDLVQIITIFSCRLQGKRANKAKKIIKELLCDDKDSKSYAST